MTAVDKYVDRCSCVLLRLIFSAAVCWKSFVTLPFTSVLNCESNYDQAIVFKSSVILGV